MKHHTYKESKVRKPVCGYLKALWLRFTFSACPTVKKCNIGCTLIKTGEDLGMIVTSVHEIAYCQIQSLKMDTHLIY